MYLLRILIAVFRPGMASARIVCSHPNQKSALIDLGRNKMWWCDDCGAGWFASGHAA